MPDDRGPVPLRATRSAQRIVLSAAMLLAGTAAFAAGPSLRPSTASLDRQNLQAAAHDLSFLRSSSDVRRFVERGFLVPVRGSADIELHAVSFPFARPQVRDFIDRLGRGYRRACGERLVVTSLTRPRSRQPRNASHRSVHPTGMAVDLRYPRGFECRAWLEDTLLHLEGAGAIEASFEDRPAHYHLAVFPRPYTAFVAARGTIEPPRTIGGDRTYRVRQGDNLWKIARRHNIGVRRLRTANRLRSNLIRPGQVLRIPAAD